MQSVSHVLENREALNHTQSQGKALQFKELIPTGSMLSALPVTNEPFARSRLVDTKSWKELAFPLGKSRVILVHVLFHTAAHPQRLQKPKSSPGHLRIQWASCAGLPSSPTSCPNHGLAWRNWIWIPALWSRITRVSWTFFIVVFIVYLSRMLTSWPHPQCPCPSSESHQGQKCSTWDPWLWKQEQAAFSVLTLPWEDTTQKTQKAKEQITTWTSENCLSSCHWELGQSDRSTSGRSFDHCHRIHLRTQVARLKVSSRSSIWNKIEKARTWYPTIPTRSDHIHWVCLAAVLPFPAVATQNTTSGSEDSAPTSNESMVAQRTAWRAQNYCIRYNAWIN